MTTPNSGPPISDRVRPEWRKAVAASVASAPPLSDETKMKLAALLATAPQPAEASSCPRS